MFKQIIPHDRWDQFFAELNREYQGAYATLEVLPENVGPQLAAYDQPFEEISAEGQATNYRIAILLGETFTHTIDTPLRIYTEPYSSGAGRVVQIESASAPLTRLYLSHSAEQSTGRGEIYGGQDQPADSRGRPAQRGDTDKTSRSGASSTDVDLNVGASRGDAPDIGGVLGIGLGGVSSIGGGSLGDRDLSGRRAGSTEHTIGRDADVIAPGGDAPVIDRGADPIGGIDEDEEDDATDEMIEGEVGAQAERDFTELFDPESAARQRARRKQRGQPGHDRETR